MYLKTIQKFKTNYQASTSLPSAHVRLNGTVSSAGGCASGTPRILFIRFFIDFGKVAMFCHFTK